MRVLPDSNPEILDLIHKYQESIERISRERQEDAKSNETYYAGKFMDTFPVYSDEVKPVDYNYLTNITNTLVAQLSNAQPTAVAYPTNQQARDSYAAEIANKLIAYISRENDYESLWDQVILNMVLHGSAGIKCVYDESVIMEPVSIFEFDLDHSVSNWTDAQWVIFKRYDQLEAVEDLLQEAGEDPNVAAGLVEEYQSGPLGNKEEGVCIKEFWHRPTSRVPRGLYCLVVGDLVLNAQEYPYHFVSDDGEHDSYPLPLVVVNSSTVNGNPLGIPTAFNTALRAQKELNLDEGVFRHLKDLVSHVRMAAPNSVADLIREGDQIIETSEAEKIRFIAPPQIEPILVQDRPVQIARMYDLAGVSELSTGAQEIKAGTSAKHVSYVSGLDSNKHAMTVRSINKAVKHLWRLALNLVQKYYLVSRTIEIADVDGFVVLNAFNGAQIQGVDVALEEGSGRALSRSAQAVSYRADAQAGLADPARVSAVDRSGIPDSDSRDQAAEVLTQELAQAAEGLTPPLSAPPEQAVLLLTDYLAIARDQKLPFNQKAIMLQMLELYKNKAREQRAAQVQE